LRRFTTYLSILAVVALSFVQVAQHELCCGDTNGDHRVNVQDVQIVIAEILDDVHPGDVGDINADGYVNVLDLQLVLHQATRARPQEESTSSKTKPDKAIPVKHNGFAIDAENRPALAGVNADTLPTVSAINSDPVVICSLKTERYLLTLTAHAPPAWA
jgi:hypothetical protein